MAFSYLPIIAAVIFVASANIEETPTTSQPSAMINLNQDTFNNRTKVGKYFVMFFSPTCLHSSKLIPVWEQLAQVSEFEGKVGIAKIDCIANQKPCTESNIAGYPTLVWLENGEQIKRYSAFMDFVNLRYFIRQMIKKSNEAAKDLIRSKNDAETVNAVEVSDNQRPDYTFFAYR